MTMGLMNSIRPRAKWSAPTLEEPRKELPETPFVGLDGDYSKLSGGAELHTDAGHPGVGDPVEHFHFEVGDFHGVAPF